MLLLDRPNLSPVDRAVDSLTETLFKNPRATGELSFPFFCWYYLKDHFSSGFGQFQYPIMAVLQDLKPNNHLMAMLPREHGKSTLVTFAWVLWKICYRMKRHIVIGSAVTDTSKKFLANIKAELQMNQLILRDFGDLVGEPLLGDEKRPWRASYIRTTNYVVVVASSTGSTVRGLLERLPETLNPIGWTAAGKPLYKWIVARPDLIIMDDMIDDKKIKTKQTRDSTWTWFWKNLFPAQQMGEGNVVVVGTPLHEDDAISRFYTDKTQTQGWQKFVLPAADPDCPFDEHGNPRKCLFPEKWAQIDKTRPIQEYNKVTGAYTEVFRSFLWWRSVELGPAFNPEFLLRPMNDQTRYFNRSDFGWYVLKDAVQGNALFDTVYQQTGKLLEWLPSDLICVTTLDPAGTDEEYVKDATDPDYSVVMTMGYSPSTRKFYLVAVNRMRTTPFGMLQTLLAHVMMFSQAHGAKYVPDRERPHEFYQGLPFHHIGIGIETVAFQKVLAPMLEEIAHALGMYPMVIELSRGSRAGKRMRAMLPSTLCQNGLLMMPFPLPGADVTDIEATFRELGLFPQGDHDDTVDALTDAMHILYAYSLILGRSYLSGTMANEETLAELVSGQYGFRATSQSIERFLNGAPAVTMRPAGVPSAA